MFMPKTEQSVESLIRSVRNLELDCWDKVESLRDLDCVITDEGKALFNDYEDMQMGITDLAVGQLCTKLGLPVRYFRKLASPESPKVFRDLAQHNLNTLLGEESPDRVHLVRMYQNNIRGVLSERYSVFDTPDIMDVLSDSLSDDLAIRGSHVSYEDFHVRLTSRKPLKILGFDKDVFLGLQITSSDVGKSTLNIQVFLWKQVCTNGMCLPIFDRDLYRQKHLGLSLDVFRDGLLESMGVMSTLKLKVQDLLKTRSVEKLDENLFNKEKDVGLAFKEFVGIPLEDLSLLERLNKHYSNTVTVWSVTSALTEYAQKEGISFDRRLELERKAGELLVNYGQFA